MNPRERTYLLLLLIVSLGVLARVFSLIAMGMPL